MLQELIANIQSLKNDINLQRGSDLDKFINILSKPAESRTPKQIQGLLEYIKLNKGLSQLAEKTSLKFMKMIIMKYAAAVYVDTNYLITQQGDPINNIYILLYGKIATAKKRDNLTNYSIIQNLGAIATQQVKENNKLKRKRITRRLSKQFMLGEGNFRKNRKKYIEDNLFQIDVVGYQDRSVGNKYLDDTISLQQCLILEIPIAGFLNAFFIFFQDSKLLMHQKIGHLSCFHGIQRQKLQHLITSLEEKTQKRGNYIYKQGEQATSLYFLAKGQIKLTKQTNLFVQNPNNLYANRVSLLIDNNQQQNRYNPKEQNIKKRQAILPYADLTQMFNFSPKKKLIQIGQIEPFCMFGEQQFIEGKKRQTNALCNTLQVTYYQISVQKIQQIFGSKAMISFFKGITMQAKNKVLHRQVNFANTMNLQNKVSLDYFYLEGQKQKSPPKTFRINKLNNKLVEGNITEKQRFKSLDHPKIAFPKYTAFNFQKIASSPITQRKVQKKPKLKKKYSNPESSKEFSRSSQQLQKRDIMPSNLQLRVMSMTHTWKFIKDKANGHSSKSSKSKFAIDVNEPLIDNNYLNNLQKEKKRVQRKIRKQKMATGLESKSRVTSLTSKGFAKN